MRRKGPTTTARPVSSRHSRAVACGRDFARLALAAGEFPVAGVDGPLRTLPDQETIRRGG